MQTSLKIPFCEGKLHISTKVMLNTSVFDNEWIHKKDTWRKKKCVDGNCRL